MRPWLPYGDHATRNVAAQRDDSGSALRLCRDLIALRSAEFRERIASYRQLPAPPGVWAFQAGHLQVTANFSDTPTAVTPAAGPVLACSTAGALGERDSDLADAPGAGDEETAIPTMDRVCEGSKRGRDVSPGPFGTKGL